MFGKRNQTEQASPSPEVAREPSEQQLRYFAQLYAFYTNAPEQSPYGIRQHFAGVPEQAESCTSIVMRAGVYPIPQEHHHRGILEKILKNRRGELIPFDPEIAAQYESHTQLLEKLYQQGLGHYFIQSWRVMPDELGGSKPIYFASLYAVGFNLPH